MPSWLARNPNELVKPPRIQPRLVGGELHQSATSLPAFGYRPFDEATPQSFVPAARCNPYALDLTAPRAQARETWNERDLNAPDDHAAGNQDSHQLIGIALYRVEGIDIFVIDRSGGVFPGLPKLIIGQQGDNALEVRALRASKDDLCHARKLTRQQAIVAARSC